MKIPKTKKAFTVLKSLRLETKRAQSQALRVLNEELKDGEAAQLADALEISQPYLSDIRSAKRGLTDELIDKVIKVGN